MLGAVLMVAGALAIRSRLDAGDRQAEEDAAQVRGTLVCATELRAACDALHAANPALVVRVEDAATTEAALASASFEPGAASGAMDAWLVTQPHPAMVAETRKAATLDPVLADPTPVLGRSPVVLAVWTDRLGALTASCPGGASGVTWACIGAGAGQPWTALGGQETWGLVKPGVPDARSAAGLAVLAQATTQKLGRADWARNELDDAGYQAWLGGLKAAVPSSSSAATPLEQMLSVGKSSLDLAGGVEATAGPAVASSREKDRVTILYPAPMATLDVVLAPVKGAAQADRLRDCSPRPSRAPRSPGPGGASTANRWPTVCAATSRSPTATASRARASRWPCAACTTASPDDPPPSPRARDPARRPRPGRRVRRQEGAGRRRRVRRG